MTATEQDEERRLKFDLTQLNKQLTRLMQSDKADAARVTEVEAKLDKARLDYEAFQNTLYDTHPELKSQRGQAPIAAWSTSNNPKFVLRACSLASKAVSLAKGARQPSLFASAMADARAPQQMSNVKTRPP